MKNSPVGVVLAGGRGTRLGWLGNLLPKALVPVGQKPILYHIIKNLEQIGVKEIYLLVNYKKELIKKYLREEKDFNGIIFHYITSEPNLGLADVIFLTEKYIKEPFVAILGDDFTKSKQIKEFAVSNLDKSIIATEAIIEERDKKVLSSTCEIYTDSNGLITKAVEKPKKPHSKIRGCGIYFFKPEVFDYIKITKPSAASGKKEITDTINLIAKEGKASAWFLNGVNVNINTQEDLDRAIKYLFIE